MINFFLLVNGFIYRLSHQSYKSKQILNLLVTTNVIYRKKFYCKSSYINSHNENKNNSKSIKNEYIPKKLLTFSLLLASSILCFYTKKETAFSEQAEKNDEEEEEEEIVPGKFIDNLPVYTESDVAQHKTPETRIWVIFKNGVYDVTDFVEQHPGGTKILLAAGSSIEPFWALYAQHHTAEVYGMLEQLRIGNIKIDEKKLDDSSLDPYGKDPKRHPVLKAASIKPFNAEPPSSLLVDKFYTPR